MDFRVVVLSGMPASGKDSVTDDLCASDEDFYLFKKHRGGSRNHKDTYIDISESEFNDKVDNGDFVQWHSRYGRYYGIDAKELFDALKKNLIPIIHIGRIENFYKFKENLQSLAKKRKAKVEIVHILLWNTVSALRERILKRDGSDASNRLDAVEQEFADNVAMTGRGEKPYDLVIKNDSLSDTVAMIKKWVKDDTLGADERKKAVAGGYVEFYAYLSEWNNCFNKLGSKQADGAEINITSCTDDVIFDRSTMCPVVMDGINFGDSFKLVNCNFYNICLKNLKCKSITIEKCDINELKFYNCNFEQIFFNDDNLGLVCIEGRAMSGVDRVIDFKKCNCEKLEFKIDKDAIINLHVGVQSTIKDVSCYTSTALKNIFVNMAVIEMLTIESLPNVSVSNKGKINKINVENLDKKLIKKQFGKIRKLENSALISRREVLTALYSYYDDNNRFSQSDICLYYLRNTIALLNYRNASAIKKFFLLIGKFLIGKCFGWGIKIMNNIVTLFATVIAFGFIYSLTNTDKFDTQNVALSLYNPFECSVIRFFNLNDATPLPVGDLGIVESVLGVIILTIITGVIVRKVIR